MKRTTSLIICAALTATAATAQETYLNAQLATQDLNGTARYVAMGGAMDALGADLSTISSNPAGIGLFRSSQAKVSFGFVSQQDARSFADASKTKMSFDQAGFVYARRSGRRSFINFAFNYHKSTNFNHILSAAAGLNGASQNKLSAAKNNKLFDVKYDPYANEAVGYFPVNRELEEQVEAKTFNQVDFLYYNTLIGSLGEDNTVNTTYYNATGYDFARNNTGYIGVYDFNLSGNINDRVYLGVTFGVEDVHYNGYSEYTETVIVTPGALSGSTGAVRMADSRIVTGTGFNLKFGAIVRPVADWPLRIGLSVATPTWYDLTSRNRTTLHTVDYDGTTNGNYSESSYDFKLYTPWKFGVSLGTTVGNFLAIGAGYEYADYGTIDTREKTWSEYDWYTDTYYDHSVSDRNMNGHAKASLKGVSTLKVGVEFKPDPMVAVRLGYNYVSPMYHKNAEKGVNVYSPGTFYTSATDFTNWKSTNRLTCGVGVNINKFTLDLAYQYSAQDGDFRPFTSYSDTGDATLNCIPGSTKVSNKRHQAILTLGYTF